MNATEQASLEVVQACARVLVRAALALIEGDPHQYSTRPCPTCRTISNLMAEPFGCNKKAGEKRS